MFMMPLHPPERDRTSCLEEDVELVKLCDRLGFEEAWIGQHHTLPWEPIPSNDVFIGYCIPVTERIRFGTGVTITPIHHPANVATRLAMLDHMSRGRLMVGFGPGGVPADFELFGIDPKDSGLMNLEAMDMVVDLWKAEPPFKLEGDYWTIKVENPDPSFQMGWMLKPYQQPHPPLAISILKPQSMGATTAGERGYIPISANVMSLNWVPRHWELYAEGAAKARRPEPDRDTWRVCRSIVVGETEKDAVEFSGGVYERSYDYMLKILKAGKAQDAAKDPPTMTDDELDVDYVMKNINIVGSVDQVVERLLEVYAATGGFGTLCMMAQDSDGDPRWWKSVELLATEVMPAVNKALG